MTIKQDGGFCSRGCAPGTSPPLEGFLDLRPLGILASIKNVQRASWFEMSVESLAPSRERARFATAGLVADGVGVSINAVHYFPPSHMHTLYLLRHAITRLGEGPAAYCT